MPVSQHKPFLVTSSLYKVIHCSNRSCDGLTSESRSPCKQVQEVYEERTERKEGEYSHLDDLSDLENLEGCWKINAIGLVIERERKNSQQKLCEVHISIGTVKRMIWIYRPVIGTNWKQKKKLIQAT